MNAGYIEEYGVITELKEQRVATVMCRRNSACDHCPSSGACNIGDDGENMQVDAINEIGAQVGDRVKVVTSSKLFLQSSFMLYIVPLIGLLIGALLGQKFGPRVLPNVDPSLLSAIAAVVFLAATFLAIRIRTRGLRREGYMPRIVSVEADM